MADLQVGGKDKDNPDYRGNMEKMEELKEESMDTSDFAAFKTPAKDFKRYVCRLGHPLGQHTPRQSLCPQLPGQEQCSQVAR